MARLNPDRLFDLLLRETPVPELGEHLLLNGFGQRGGRQFLSEQPASRSPGFGSILHGVSSFFLQVQLETRVFTGRKELLRRPGIAEPLARFGRHALEFLSELFEHFHLRLNGMIGGETQNPAPELAFVHDVDGVDRQNLFEMQNEPIGLLAELRLREHVEGKAKGLLKTPGQRIVRQRLKPGRPSAKPQTCSEAPPRPCGLRGASRPGS